MHPRIAKLLQRYVGLNLYRVLVRPLGRVPAGAPMRGIRFEVLEESALLAHCADPELELSSASAREAFARGDICTGVLQGERLLGYAWFAFGSTPESGGIWVDFAPHAIYTYRHFVRPGHRGRRLVSGLLSAADARAAGSGRSSCLTLVYTHNKPSIRATERSGARTVGYAACLKLFGRLLYWRSRGARRQQLRFYRPQSNLSRFSFAMRRLASMLAATASRN